MGERREVWREGGWEVGWEIEEKRVGREWRVGRERGRGCEGRRVRVVGSLCVGGRGREGGEEKNAWFGLSFGF